MSKSLYFILCILIVIMACSIPESTSTSIGNPDKIVSLESLIDINNLSLNTSKDVELFNSDMTSSEGENCCTKDATSTPCCSCCKTMVDNQTECQTENNDSNCCQAGETSNECQCCADLTTFHGVIKKISVSRSYNFSLFVFIPIQINDWSRSLKKPVILFNETGLSAGFEAYINKYVEIKGQEQTGTLGLFDLKSNGFYAHCIKQI